MTGHFEKGAWIEDPEPKTENRDLFSDPLIVKIGLELPEFLTATRVRFCLCGACANNLVRIDEPNCNNKFVEIGENGECLQFRRRPAES